MAAAAVAAGHETVLVSGPSALRTPRGVERVDVVSAREMAAAVSARIGAADILVMAAAVADWRPEFQSPVKLKKSGMRRVLRLVRNPDILSSLSGVKGNRVFVGFAAETGDPEAEALRKLRAKNLDFIVANDVSAPGCGFASVTNAVAIYARTGGVERIRLSRKTAIARRIVAMAAEAAEARL